VQEFLQQQRMLIGVRPDSADAWGDYGMALDAHEFDAAARECYRQAVRLDPHEPQWKYLLASRLQHDAPQEARRLLADVAVGEDVPLAALLLYADVLATLNLDDQRQEILQRAAADEPGHPAVRFRLARLALQQSRLAEAERLLQQLEQEFVETARLEDQLALQQGKRLNTDGQARQTLPSIRDTVRDPWLAQVAGFRRDPLWRGKQAADEYRQGNELALLTLRSLVRRHPELIDNRLELAMLMLSKGESDAAGQIIRTGLEQTPEDVRLLAAAGTVEIYREDWARARRFLQTLVDLQPADAAGWADLGFVYEQTGDTDRAKAAYEKSLQLQPDTHVQDRLHQLIGP
jgi:Flp pilus assembly protein TadD